MIPKFTLVLERVLLPLALMIFVYALGITKTIESDTFWHIKTGELIVKNLSIPKTNPFTFTMEDEPWIDSDGKWFSQVVFYLIHAIGGLTALTLFKALIVALTYLLLYIHWGNTPFLTFPLILCIAIASRLKFYERPQIFTFLFLAIFVVLIERYREGKTTRLLAFPLIMIPWANIHPGCIMGLLLYGTILVGEAAKFFLNIRWGVSPGPPMPRQKLLKFCGVFFLTFLASFLNLHTYRIYSFLFSHFGLNSLRKGGISEFLPLSFSDTSTSFPLALMSILSVVTLLSILLNRREADLSVLLLLPAFGIPTLKMRRFVAEFFIVSTAAFVRALRVLHIPSRLDPVLATLRPTALFILFLIPLPIYIHLRNSDYNHYLGLGVHRLFFPVEAMDFIDKQKIQGNIFNSQNYGGALLYRFFPKRQVFFDTTLSSYESLLPRLTKAMRDGQSFDMILSLYKVEAALVESEMGGKFIKWGLFPRDKWALVYWDDLSEVFVRRLKKYAHLIQSSEYTTTNSETIFSSQEINSHDPAVRLSVQKELERLLRADPNVSKAWYALGILHGNSEEAISNLKKALEVEPSFPEAHEALARIYHITGMFTEALSHYNDAFLLKRFFGVDKEELALLLNEMGTISLSMGKTRQAIRYLKRAARLDPTNTVIRANLQSALAQKASK